MDKIWYASLTPSKSAYQVTSGGKCNVSATVNGCGANNWYTVYLAADDDDGNLANGTPNACRIWDAFNAHGIACGTRPACSGGTPDFTIAATPASQSVCAPGTTSYTVNIGATGGFSNNVTLAASGLPSGVTASFAPNPVAPGSSSTLTLNVASSAAAGSYTVTINGTASGSAGHSATTQLVVNAGAPAAPTLSAPANGATGVSTSPTLSWNASAGASTYTLEVATDAAFSNIVQNIPAITTTSRTVTGLSSATTYHWRVRAVSGCGSNTSGGFSFTTSTSSNVLQNGVPVTGLSATTGNSLLYTMVVPAGATNLRFVTSGGTGDADLYVKFGSAPTTSSYDCRSIGSTNSETCAITTAQAGTYYVLVYSYANFSGLSLTGSFNTGGGNVLQNGVPVSGLAATSGNSVLYTMEVPAGATNLRFTTTGGTGDADLYVRFGAAPTTSTYTCRSWTSSNAETCNITPAQAGTYYVMVRAYATFSGVTLTGSYTP
ncbi:pre-peptidase C-terminal domain-containing protein [Tahibacter amnicola]